MSDTEDKNNDTPKKEWVQFEEGKNNAEEEPQSIPATLELTSDGENGNETTSSPTSKTTNWVKFEENAHNIANNHHVIAKTIEGVSDKPSSASTSPSKSPKQEAAVHPLSGPNSPSKINAESVTINLSGNNSQHAALDIQPSSNNYNSRQTRDPVITQGFTNGDCIVSVLPMNDNCPWFTKAKFKPELVPEELMAQGLTLTVEDYVQAMKILVSDFRFNMFIICYKRILILWVLIGFIFLISFLFSGLKGIVLFICGIIWLIVNAFGIFFCMWFKIKLNKGLEYCMAEVNSYLYKQKVILALDDRGKLSCHKVNLIFLYFDLTDCLKYLNDILKKRDQLNGTQSNDTRREVDLSKMDIDESGIVIVGNTNTVLSQREKRGEKLLLRYLQRWAKEYVRKRIDLNVDIYNEGMDFNPLPERHSAISRCPCQYIEEYLSFKPTTKCPCNKIFDI